VDDLDALVAGVRLLCLDAGNTIIFLDHARLAGLLAKGGENVTAETLVRCEGEAKCALEDGASALRAARSTPDAGPVTPQRWENDREPGALGWGKTLGLIFERAGIARERVPSLLASIWPEHVALNLWWVVPPGLGEALDAIRALGVKVVVVSNSEGMLDVLFERLGIARHLDLVVDSGKVGVEKPDPGIWEIALTRYPTPADRVLHLGDTHATDIAGAERLGFRAGLIDPFAHYAGRHPRVTRVPGVVEVAQAIVRTASRAGSLA
jgi:FMN phosphatase YigB (HAD superfamily)